MEFRKVALASILTASFGITGTAAANDMDDRGFYAGTGAGIYYIDFDDIDFDESANTIRVFGGYQMSEYLSFEAGYSSMFEASTSVLGADVEVDGTAWDISVRPSFPLGDRMKAFGILGWTEYDFDISAAVGPVVVSDSNAESDLFYGLGAEFDLNDRWSFRGEWVAIDVDDADFGTLSVSATYDFK